jgi:hypothetical protein
MPLWIEPNLGEKVFVAKGSEKSAVKNGTKIDHLACPVVEVDAQGPVANDFKVRNFE